MPLADHPGALTALNARALRLERIHEKLLSRGSGIFLALYGPSVLIVLALAFSTRLQENYEPVLMRVLVATFAVAIAASVTGIIGRVVVRIPLYRVRRER